MTKNDSGGSRHSDKRAGSGHPNPEMGREGGGGGLNFFSALRASVWFKNKGPGRLPWIRP